MGALLYRTGGATQRTCARWEWESLVGKHTWSEMYTRGEAVPCEHLVVDITTCPRCGRLAMYIERIIIGRCITLSTPPQRPNNTFCKHRLPDHKAWTFVLPATRRVVRVTFRDHSLTHADKETHRAVSTDRGAMIDGRKWVLLAPQTGEWVFLLWSSWPQKQKILSYFHHLKEMTLLLFFFPATSSHHFGDFWPWKRQACFCLGHYQTGFCLIFAG